MLPGIDFCAHVGLDCSLCLVDVVHLFDVVMLKLQATTSDFGNALLIFLETVENFVKLFLVHNLCHVSFLFDLNCTETLAVSRLSMYLHTATADRWKLLAVVGFFIQITGHFEAALHEWFFQWQPGSADMVDGPDVESECLWRLLLAGKLLCVRFIVDFLLLIFNNIIQVQWRVILSTLAC